MSKTTNSTSRDVIVALDVGEARIGVATANRVARLASPHSYIANGDDVWDELKQILTDVEAAAVVVGLPRGLSGQATDQTRLITAFADTLAKHVDMPVHLQDEALTSKQAESELNQRGKPFTKGDVDALAACYILTDYINEGKTW